MYLLKKQTRSLHSRFRKKSGRESEEDGRTGGGDALASCICFDSTCFIPFRFASLRFSLFFVPYGFPYAAHRIRFQMVYLVTGSQHLTSSCLRCTLHFSRDCVPCTYRAKFFSTFRFHYVFFPPPEDTLPLQFFGARPVITDSISRT